MCAIRFLGLLALALLVSLLAACQPTGGHVGVVATGHFSARHEFPVLIVAWCGDTGPRQIDLVDGRSRRHLVATREFDGNRLEVDLAAPGEDWRITDGEGEPVYRLVPESERREYRVGVGSVAGGPGEATEHDIGTVVFTTGALADDAGVYVRAEDAPEAEFSPREAFPPEC
ncbi:antitoxin (DNA-binding transcriptional repressor) of toxin-antitoxin stability system [Nocardiopsis arvandica]|uniref:Antitoxin (DNA-binding transcriptional repressor) of toxin-antitoxin stability system n=1 Tax=Nocardiopsis sinuspersici TaxID=501010 RepID=A0A7Z0BJH5_9ACTN|nr:hypothetical protein [Nocardiopsis sinuspersici]NYH53778.1 antitoxin (DNA-binding transcriptional repressor) of toxin-antitoxin stability system [Nocardiopsis sinuspersici]